MNKFLYFFVLAVIATSATAFTTGPVNGNRAKLSKPISPADMPSYDGASSTTSTSLNLKVKVDPNAKTKNAAGNAKAAAYGGSIAIAALLPIAFLVWSAISKP